MSSTSNEELVKKRSEYINYLSKLNNLKTTLNRAKSDLVNSKTTFESGGYNNDGVIIGGDILKNACNSIETNISDLNLIITNTQKLIDNMIEE